ncbi:MAG: hypothetical protein WBP40_03240 [Candidatus Moraniibacteriota bacterium]
MLSANHHQGLLVFERGGRVYLFWRSAERSMPGIFSVESPDGRTFKKALTFVALYRPDGTKTVLGSSPELRAGSLGTKTLLSFLDERKNTLFATIEKDGAWKIIAATDSFRAPSVVLAPKSTLTAKSPALAFFSRDGRIISLARSTGDLTRWKDLGDVLAVRPNNFDAANLSPLHAEITVQGTLLVYSAQDRSGQIVIGAALFDRKHPTTTLWRSDHALWTAPIDTPPDAAIIGGGNIGKYFSIYLQSAEHGIESYPIARYWETYRQRVRPTLPLPPRIPGIRIPIERFAQNPIIEPVIRNSWEAFATFNPAAIYLDGRIHLLYRAQGYDGQSVLGYASSGDGVHIDERHADPAFVPSRAAESAARTHALSFVSGGGTGGCEDPRLVEIDGVVYLIYVAFDGANPPGVALTHIAKADFLAKRWEWARPKLISLPGEIQKNWVLFPEQINGKYAIIHGLSPEIRIEYVDSLKKLGDGHYIRSLKSHGGRGYIEPARLRAWDNIVRGVGAPPIKTEYGWLVFYHGMDLRDPGKYKVGVMLLDLEHPEKILRRALEPVLEPEAVYENSGHKPGVIYVCGAVIKDKKLLVYYGAADRSTGVAMADLDSFLGDLLKNTPPTLTKMNVKKLSS